MNECSLDCCHVQVAILSLNRRGEEGGGGAECIVGSGLGSS